MQNPDRPESTVSSAAYRPFGSVEDYVLGCTDEIWAERGVGLIESTYYSADVVLHGSMGTTVGVESVVRGTVGAIAAFPDGAGRGEDVVWEGRGTNSFISSHRVLTSAVNTGWSGYGAPTGRSTIKRAVAHCLVQDARIVAEWVVRDEYRSITDLGLDPETVAAALAAAGSWRPLDMPSLTRGSEPDVQVRGVSGPRPEAGMDAHCRAVATLITQAFNARMAQQLPSLLHVDVVLHTSRGRTVLGVRNYSTEMFDFLAPFPDGHLQMLDLCAHQDARRGKRVALVWLFTGTYCGAPKYGPNTGKPVQILGCSHFLFHDGLIVEEFRVYDELALLVQIKQSQRSDPP